MDAATIERLRLQYGFPSDSIDDKVYEKLARHADHRTARQIREDITSALKWIKSDNYETRKKGLQILCEYGSIRRKYGI